jgi:hypothetical protein
MTEGLERVPSRARALLGSRSASRAAGPAAAESAGARVGPPDEVDRVAIARLLMAARATTGDGRVAGLPVSRDADTIASLLVDRARAAMLHLENGASDGAVDRLDAVALESVMRTRGRPALAFEGDRLEALDPVKHPGSGFWRSLLDDNEARIIRVGNATGAVVVRDKLTDSPSWVQGTAWLVRADLAVTNRHVLFPPPGGVRVARRVAGSETEARLKDDYETILDFAFDDGPTRDVRHVVEGIVYVSAELDPIDVAVLRVKPMTGSAIAPLTLAQPTATARQLYVVGHPGKVDVVPDDVQAVFGTPNGRKRVCCGQTMPADPARPGELTHDASTIGGFSGGCVLGFTSDDVVALHYYGDPVVGNRAITVGALRAQSVMGHI